ncbi:hypothetical protein RhiirA5_421562 [Rhizophagus irregularis]|uniref:Uncharacterized protein n=2 Tax=Rhizophagus irregularis TaxID=588596 RepID=A0A2N0PDQ3_9GLOM|nr:hypothetical protein RhiirA5_421562 [Rhizophagus irregularis]
MLAIGSTSTNRKQKLDTDSSAEIDADKKDRINQALIESHSQLNCFIIITPGKRQYIHTLKDISVDSHTGSFNATEIENILTTIGPKKFAAVASIFMELIKIAVAIKQISNYLDLDFNNLKDRKIIINYSACSD